MRIDRDFYKNRKILITGHTGFKGTWMCQVLLELGAEVTGYALQPPTDPSLFSLTGMAEQMQSIEGDVRDLEHLLRVFEEMQPEIVIHMAAQPIVRESYANPVYTYDVNVMGTVNVLECVRRTASVRSFVNVTTDKVYKNREWEWGYRENEELNGFDPYSNSKSCSELVTYSYRNSFFSDGRVAISTARAGNVIGGGDFAADRIVPDCMRAVMREKEIVLRNPASTRPYQHVLEPVMAYLLIAEKQYRDGKYAGCYNVGPEETSCLTTGELGIFQCLLGSKTKQTVCIPLECGKIIELRRCYPLFFLYHGSDKSLSVFTGSCNPLCFRFITDMLRYSIQTIFHDMSHIIGFFLEIHDFTFTVYQHGKCRCLHSANLQCLTAI